jgi:hypothetical protein
VEWHDRIKLSVWYVEHLTLWLDVKIFFLTIFKVFSNADNENTGATVVRGSGAEGAPEAESPISEEAPALTDETADTASAEK